MAKIDRKNLDKNLKLQVKNAQIAEAINLRGLKAKLSKKKQAEEEAAEERYEGSLVAPVEVLDSAQADDSTQSDQKSETSKKRSKKVLKAEQKTEEKAEQKEKVELKVESKEKVEIEKAQIPPTQAQAMQTQETRHAPLSAEHAVPSKAEQDKIQELKIQTPSKESSVISSTPTTENRIEAKPQPFSHGRPSHTRPPHHTRGRESAPHDRGGFHGGSSYDRGGYRSSDSRSGDSRSTGGPRYTPQRPSSSTTGWKEMPPRQGGPSHHPHPHRRPPFREEGYQRRDDTTRRDDTRRTDTVRGPSFHRHPDRYPAGGGPSTSGPSRPPRFPSGGPDARRMPSFARGGPRPDSRMDLRQRPQVPLPAKPEGLGERKASERTERKPYTEFDSEKKSKLKAKETQPTKPVRKGESKDIDARIRHGFVGSEEDETGWRKKRPTKQFRQEQPQDIIRPSKISVKIPISVKDLASEMKLKASELIGKLFLQGVIVTLNDLLSDELVVQLLGQEFGCEISIDTREEERIRVTDKTVREEIGSHDPSLCKTRPPVVAFMGHVDHGKTSLIDYIRKSNVASHEVGAITQHIGAFRCHTSHGDITILDTPGHEAFSHMRERGAEATDIVVLVVAGDEGMKEQTLEALNQARQANTTIVVALNKCDKPHFNAETVYRQLADHNLLPESWGGQTICIHCSAVTGEGIQELLEMLALQAEVLELKANPDFRARGTVIESEMHKGLGPVACVLVQNGTLHVGDCLVFASHWGRVKTMRDEAGKDLLEAVPSTPALINGLSGLPDAGETFIVVKNEKEAKEIATARQEGKRQTGFQTKKRLTVESMMEKAADTFVKKTLNLILRADVQGSAEALKNSINKIQSKKVETNILSTAVGDISESDVQLAQASKAVIIGFHTNIDTHVEASAKELGVQVRLHNIIYHAVDDIRELMKNLLDKIPQETARGKAEIKATFKSSHLGLIAGCQVIDGVINRNCQVRVVRGGKVLWKGAIASVKRHKDDVREVQKGMECGILLQGFADFQQGDILEAFEVTYLIQEL